MEKTYTPQGFIDGTSSGGIPLVIPISDPMDAEHYINAVDGLILAGGQDVSPIFMIDEPSLGVTHPARDALRLHWPERQLTANRFLRYAARCS